VPEARQIFPTLSVSQNLELGLKRAGRSGRWSFDDMFALFPNLSERRHNQAGVLSGGEQQMLTVCRTLMGDPDLIIIDEPTEGLAPKLIEHVATLLDEIARRGVAILLVEQKLTIALKLARRVMVMGHGRIVFEGAHAEPLGPTGAGASLVRSLLDRAAVLVAFEQVGGAQAALDMAREYALGRFAFGRPIASFQAIKHKLVDMYVAIELARSNAYYGAWALSTNARELPVAAAAARVSATEAFWLAAKENIQTHGGMGFTWEFDCHLYYRRAKLLALALGSARHWKHELITRLSNKAA